MPNKAEAYKFDPESGERKPYPDQEPEAEEQNLEEAEEPLDDIPSISEMLEGLGVNTTPKDPDEEGDALEPGRRALSYALELFGKEDFEGQEEFTEDELILLAHAITSEVEESEGNMESLISEAAADRPDKIAERLEQYAAMPLPEGDSPEDDPEGQPPIEEDAGDQI